jgi:MFS family permease
VSANGRQEGTPGEPPVVVAKASATSMLLAASAAQAGVSFMVIGLPSIGPQLRSEFGLSLAGLGALLATMQFGSGIALVGAGRAVDRYGARAATRAGTALATVGLVIAALAPSTPLVFVGLLLSGIGAAIIPVSGAGAIFRAYPSRRRAWALGVRQTAVPVGGLIAAVLVPALEAAEGIRLVLAVGAVAVGALGMVFSSASDDVQITHEGTVGLFRGIWHEPGVKRLLVVTVTYLFLLQTVLSYTVPAMRAAGFSAVQAGVGYVVVNATAIVSRLAWGRIADGADGTRRKRSLVETGLLAATSAVLYGLSLHGPLLFVLMALALYSFAALGWNAVVYALAGEWTTPKLAGRAFAASATVVFVGTAVVSPVIGALADWVGWDGLFGVAAAVGLLGAVVSQLLPDAVAGSAPIP